MPRNSEETAEKLDDEEPAVTKLPLIAYDSVARALPPECLPSLRLVSKRWCEAANKAVQCLSTRNILVDAYFDNLHIAVRKFTCLTTLDLSFLAGAKSRPYLEALSPLMTLKNISMYYTAAQTAAGWKFLQQQACLTRLRVVSLEYGSEAGCNDDFLHKVA